MLKRHVYCLARTIVLDKPAVSRLTRRTHCSSHAAPFRIATRPRHASRALDPALPSSWHRIGQIRGAKRTSKVDLDDLPQGAIQGEYVPVQDDAEPEYPPLLQQVRNNMLKFSHCVVLTRVGGFYEVIMRGRNGGLAYANSCTSNMPMNTHLS